MANFFSTAASFASAAAKGNAGTSITYRRGTLSASLTATKGRSEFAELDNNGHLVRTESRDWLMEADDIVLGGRAVLPQRGDRIEETAGGTKHVYELMQFGDEPPWKYSDEERVRIRVHTREVDQQ